MKLIKSLRLGSMMCLVVIGLSACLKTEKLDGSSVSAFKQSMAELSSDIQGEAKTTFIENLTVIVRHYSDDYSGTLDNPSAEFLALIHGLTVYDVEQLLKTVQEEKLQMAIVDESRQVLHNFRSRNNQIRREINQGKKFLQSLLDKKNNLEEINRLITITEARPVDPPPKYEVFETGKWIAFDVTYSGSDSVLIVGFVLPGSDASLSNDVCSLYGYDLDNRRLSPSKPSTRVTCQRSGNSIGLEGKTLAPSVIKIEEANCDSRPSGCYIRYPSKEEYSNMTYLGGSPYNIDGLIADIDATNKKIDELVSQLNFSCIALSGKHMILNQEFSFSEQEIEMAGCEGRF